MILFQNIVGLRDVGFAVVGLDVGLRDVGFAVVGLDVGFAVVGLDVGLREVGREDVGFAVGDTEGVHELPLSAMRTLAKAGELTKSMLSTVTDIDLPPTTPFHTPPALNVATNSDSSPDPAAC